MLYSNNNNNNNNNNNKIVIQKNNTLNYLDRSSNLLQDVYAIKIIHEENTEDMIVLVSI